MRVVARPNILMSAIAALFFLVAHAVVAEEAMQFAREPLAIETVDGRNLPFTVEIAATPDQRAHGLMFRKSMPADAGMLFAFGAPRPVTMWMENTPLPLDMLFIDSAGIIRHIHANAEPFSRAIIDSRGAVEFVIELNGGTAAKLGIKPGDHVKSATIERDTAQ
ncbi:DUF192 domain-containing protein [Rhizobium sp. BK251]|uniref:DUF192 domain-containing protein n=1 Tax=Rhizobium sp. BK251 TaxID=2512125 RepID=UPI00104629E4|nr:DUF192 domain-containing protein [Rhizobium sp. BK251]TCL74048.1 hypothetical protein EV286_103585 [Rhizobium sp. BK251]